MAQVARHGLNLVDPVVLRLVLPVSWWHLHVGSRKEDEVDFKGDGDTLSAKMRFLINNCPEWMVPGDLIDKALLLSYNNEEFADLR